MAKLLVIVTLLAGCASRRILDIAPKRDMLLEIRMEPRPGDAPIPQEDMLGAKTWTERVSAQINLLHSDCNAAVNSLLLRAFSWRPGYTAKDEIIVYSDKESLASEETHFKQLIDAASHYVTKCRDK